MPAISILEGINHALHQALEEDKNVVIFGEDVGINGGVFRATEGLQAKFGNHRVFDSPLAENLIAGLAVGMSTQGIKPVAEIQFMGFIYATMDQMVCHAARMRNRTQGRLSCPMVLRAPYGGGIHAPEHHSESTESMFAHIPGLRVVIPSSPKKAYGLLLAAIRDPDPVVFLEPKRLYRLGKEEVNLNGEGLPLDKAFVLKEGTDITLVSWGASLKETLEASKVLEQEGLSTEVIDVATVKPLDMDTILASVEKTGRLVIVHEAARQCSVGAEIAAHVAEYGLAFLVAPIKRVTGFDTTMPYYQLEHYYLPSIERILKASQEVLEYS